MQPPLRIPYDLITDIADRADPTPYGRMVRGDLRLIGIEGIAARSPGILWRPHIERLNAFLADASPEATARILARANECDEGGAATSRIMVDPVTRELIEARGCSVAAIALLHRMADEVTLTADDLGDERIRVELAPCDADGETRMRLDMEMPLGQGVDWCGDRLHLRDGLPETVADAAVGRALAGIVSHPALDRHRMVVTAWEDGDLHVRMRGPHGSAFA